jgi:hypothetical protein
MVVVYTDALSTLDDTPNPNWSRILNGSGRIVLVLDPWPAPGLDDTRLS